MSKLSAVAVGGLLLSAVACGGGGSPTSPSAPVSSTLSGTITATQTGQPLSGVTVDVQGTTTTTDGAGRYSLSVSSPGRLPMTIRGGTVFAHSLYVIGPTANADAIVQDGTFDPGFYRAFVHDALESSPLVPLKRWIKAPAVYLMTVDDAGTPMQAATLDMVSAAIQNTTPIWTGGSFGVASLDRGTTPPFGALVVSWNHQPSTLCGSTAVGSAAIRLDYQTPNCACGGLQTRASIVKHELGHALGFYHTDNQADLMFPHQPSASCDRDPSPRERYHAAIAYHRPLGNLDPDQDP